MNIKRFSLHKFNSAMEIPFSFVDYSKFKHGDKSIARIFGKALGDAFDVSLENNKEVVICSAPYKNIPVASTALKDYFISKFVIHNPEIDVIDLKVFRGHSYNSDYGSATADERDALISSDDFYIDSEIIKDRDLILIDDIRITGSHERRMLSLLDSVNFEGNVIFVYFAELTNTNIHPNIENFLNHAFVKDINEVEILTHKEFLFNTRVVKLILNASFDKFKDFVDSKSYSFNESLLSYSLLNKYNQEVKFQENINYLKTLIH